MGSSRLSTFRSVAEVDAGEHFLVFRQSEHLRDIVGVKKVDPEAINDNTLGRKDHMRSHNKAALIPESYFWPG